LVTIPEGTTEFLGVKNSILVAVEQCKEVTLLVVGAPVCTVDRLVLVVFTAVVTIVDNGSLEAKTHESVLEIIVKNLFVDLTC
jgi:hypothetical protein